MDRLRVIASAGLILHAACAVPLGGNLGRSLSRAPAVASRENRGYHVCRGADLVDARSCSRPAGKELNDALDSEDDRNHSRLGNQRSQVRSAQSVMPASEPACSCGIVPDCCPR